MEKIGGREFEFDKGSQDLTYVLFKDRWCSRCLDVEYILKKISAPIYIIDIAKNIDLIGKYSIEDVPTVVVFRKGRIDDFIVGVHPEKKYLSHL